MSIEFPCPVCQSPLVLKNKTSKGHLNCPKCQKLILLPSESPLPRHDPDISPFRKDQTYTAAEVTQAICSSVNPYLQELETKTDLMDDAVEMIKVRNERIRELETISLKTQSELWALEAQADEETNTGVEEPDHGALKGIPVGERAPAEHIDVLLQVAQDAHNLAEAALPLITGTEEQLSSQLAALEEGTSGLQEAKEMMETCLKIIQECSSRLEIREQAREGRDT